MEQPTNVDEVFNKLKADFDKSDDFKVAHGTVTIELFKSGEEGQKVVKEKIDGMEETQLKELALFRLANLIYDETKDVDGAVLYAEKIKDESEVSRCLVQLASAVFQGENDEDKADEIVARIKDDSKGYKGFYEKLKK
jgi:hypothetical protein